MNPRYRIFLITLASILLHVLFFFLWEGVVKLKLFDTDIPEPVARETEPLVFDLQQPHAPDLPKEVIETPADAQTVDKQTAANFLSDKNALARNQETNPNLKIGEPFARGDLDIHELPQTRGPMGQPLPPVQPEQPVKDQKVTRPAENETKSETEVKKNDLPLANEGLTRAETLVTRHMQKQRQEMRPGVQEQLPTVHYDNQQSRALDMGGLSFNTYDWNFAPYMLALKRRIQRNIHPPSAFKDLGLINGETLLRFKIYPNGMLKDLQILNYQGHQSLMVTSSNAVEISAPFPPLPRNFPEDYLEVTGKFIYFVQKIN